jgi:hypothetical protein
VAEWYKANGYQFVVISDHDKVTDVSTLNKKYSSEKFIVIPGEEVSMAGNPQVPHHANAIGAVKLIESPERGPHGGRNARLLVDCIRRTGAIPMINHPACGGWGYRELLWIRGPYLLEIANMSDPGINVGVEEAWDMLLSYGQRVYATATDDMHRLESPESKQGPGRGWVVCRVKALTQKDILDALRNGNFYASTGVELEDYSFDGKKFEVKVKPIQGCTCKIQFIGKWGKILQETEGTSAVYEVSGEHEPNSYVRCRVICGGKTAWTQAFRIGK